MEEKGINSLAHTNLGRQPSKRGHSFPSLSPQGLSYPEEARFWKRGVDFPEIISIVNWIMTPISLSLDGERVEPAAEAGCGWYQVSQFRVTIFLR